jgi:hypothetical protein
MLLIKLKSLFGLKLNYVVNGLYVYGLFLGVCLWAEGMNCSDEELINCVSLVLKNDEAIKGDFNPTDKGKDALEKSVFQLSETLKKCEPEDLGGRYFSQVLFQRIEQLRESMKQTKLTKAKIYRIVYLVLRFRAIELQQMKMEMSEMYAYILLNIYNLLIDHLTDIFSINYNVQSSTSAILNIREVALYVIFIINFMELEFLDFEPINNRIRGNSALRIPRLSELFSKQISRTGGIPAYEAHGMLRFLLESIETSLQLTNNPVGVHSSPIFRITNNSILFILNWFKSNIQKENENEWMQSLLDSYCDIETIESVDKDIINLNEAYPVF